MIDSVILFQPNCDWCGEYEHALTIPGSYLCTECAMDYLYDEHVQDVEEEYQSYMIG